jgi:hypothetical protein
MPRKRTEANGAAEDTHLPFPAERIVRLLVGIKSAFGLTEGRVVSLEDLQALSGRPAGTIGSWFEGARMNQLEFLLALLERLPSRLRHDLLDAACRTHVTLHHPKLAHDALAVSRLGALLGNRAGFTLIQGAPEHARAFLLEALGNSSREVNLGQQPVLGVVLHQAALWTAVPGVIHLSPRIDIRQQLQRAWPKIRQASDGALILLGHVWNRIPQLHPEMFQLATRCHVAIADEPLKPEDLVRRAPAPVHHLSVAPVREQPEWIRVTFQGA